MAPKTVASSQVLSRNWLNEKLPNRNTLQIKHVIHLTYCSQTTQSEVSCIRTKLICKLSTKKFNIFKTFTNRLSHQRHHWWQC